MALNIPRHFVPPPSKGDQERRGPVSGGGFSLVELLVATMLTTLVLGAVYQAFSTTARAWRTGEAAMASYQGVRASAALMTRELQSIVPGSEHLFEGTAHEVMFYAVTRPLDVEEGVGDRLLQVRYRLRDNPKGKGYILLREEAPVEGRLPLTSHVDEEPDSHLVEVGTEKSFELAGDIRDIEFSYYWLPPVEPLALGAPPAAPLPVEMIVKDENEPGWGLPQGIRIRFRVFDANSEDGETEFTTFVTFQGPTTLLDKKQAENLGGPL